jgi:glutamate-5-semialdehyde dehydrogenase
MSTTSDTMDTAAANEAVIRAVEKGKAASATLAALPHEQRNRALRNAAEHLAARESAIIEANEGDLAQAEKQVKEGTLNHSLLHRLKLNSSKLRDVIVGITQVTEQQDPLSRVTLSRELDEGLALYRVSCPIGLIAVIFESRPDALPQITSLCLKSGNGVILKGGSEARLTNRVLFDCFRAGMHKAGLPTDAIALVETREAIKVLLDADQLIDLVVPRGSNQLVSYIQANTRIPVLGHAEGICHMYVDRKADIVMAVKITIDAKTQYPAACNSVETLLLHEGVALPFMQALAAELQSTNQAIRLLCDKRTMALIPEGFPLILEPAKEEDWSTEYGEETLSVKTVDTLSDAIVHINKYGSHHTEAIITSDRAPSIHSLPRSTPPACFGTRQLALPMAFVMASARKWE